MAADVASPHGPDDQTSAPSTDNTETQQLQDLALRPKSQSKRASNDARTTRSREPSAVFPRFPSSLAYALVRDFAYSIDNPMHYGPTDDPNAEFDESDGDIDSSRKHPGDESEDGLFGASHQKPSSKGRNLNSREGQGYPGPSTGFAAARESHSNRGPGYDISIVGDMKHPPFREDSESVPYSPSALEDHRPESASLDESFAGESLALYDFSPENDNELALKEGQIIQVGYRHGQGWLVAMNLETGEQGLVPEEYVRLLRDIEGWGEDNDAEGEGGEELEPAEDETDEGEITPTGIGGVRVDAKEEPR